MTENIRLTFFGGPLDGKEHDFDYPEGVNLDGNIVAAPLENCWYQVEDGVLKYKGLEDPDDG